MYEWFKALHVISVISWMAALFYLPRLFIYHTESVIGSDKSETFKVMERRLMKVICTPAMISSWFFGLGVLWMGDWLTAGSYWVHLKLLLVFLMSGFHGWLEKRRKAFEADENTVSSRTYRFANEFPTVLMITIVILVIVKPF